MPTGHPDWQANPTEIPTVTRESGISRVALGTSTLAFGIAVGSRYRVLGWHMDVALYVRAAAAGYTAIQATVLWRDTVSFTDRDETVVLAASFNDGVGTARGSTGVVRVPGAGIVLPVSAPVEARLVLTDVGPAAAQAMDGEASVGFLLVREVV